MDKLFQGWALDMSASVGADSLSRTTTLENSRLVGTTSLLDHHNFHFLTHFVQLCGKLFGSLCPRCCCSLRSSRCITHQAFTDGIATGTLVGWAVVVEFIDDRVNHYRLLVYSYDAIRRNGNPIVYCREMSVGAMASQELCVAANPFSLVG